MVVVLVDVGIEGGIQIDVIPLSASAQAVFHGLISQPLFQFGRSDHIVNDTLRLGRDDAFISSSNAKDEVFLKCFIFSLKQRTTRHADLDVVGGQDAS